jgi:hypothetical protein
MPMSSRLLPGVLLLIVLATPATAYNSTHHQVTFINNGTSDVYINILGGELGIFQDGTTCSACSLKDGVCCNTTICENVYFNGSPACDCCGDPLVANGGFKVEKNGGTYVVFLPKGWQGNFWVRTNCVDLGDGNLKCDTANCVNNNPGDPNPKLECGGVGSQTPATKAEFAFDQNNYDTYDVSLVDGFNAPIEIFPVANFLYGCQSNVSYDSTVAGGTVDLNQKVLAEAPLLNVTNASGAVVAVLSACDYANLYDPANINKYCCLPPYGEKNDCISQCGASCQSPPADPENPTCTYCDPTTWPADVNSAALFKEYYPLGYSYADDDAASTFCTRSNVSPWGTGNVLSDYNVVIYGPSGEGGVEEEEAFTIDLMDGWNLFSTPVLLDNAHGNISGVFLPEEQGAIQIILGYDEGLWYIPSGSDPVKPLYALYVRVNGSASALVYPSEEVSGPPTRSLDIGPSLLGPAPPYESGDFIVMPLDQAFASIREAAGGLTGYVMVISPGQNQPGWAYAFGGPSRDVLPFKGYWVVMDNPDTYYGFSTTPLS